MDQFECLSESKLDLNSAALNELLIKRRLQKNKVGKSFNQNSGKGSSDNSRKEAMRLEYDFYFKNNHGLFIF